MSLVIKKLLAVMSEVGSIGKNADMKNNDGKVQYQYRSADDVAETVQPLLIKHGVLMTPYLVKHVSIDKVAKSGSGMIDVSVEVEYIFICEDGSEHKVKTAGQAFDYSDKATGKAQTAAWKAAVCQSFCIPSNQKDIEEDDIELGTKSSAQAKSTSGSVTQITSNQGRKRCPICGKDKCFLPSKQVVGTFYCWTKEGGCGATEIPASWYADAARMSWLFDDKAPSKDEQETVNLLLKATRQNPLQKLPATLGECRRRCLVAALVRPWKAQMINGMIEFFQSYFHLYEAALLLVENCNGSQLIIESLDELPKTGVQRG